ncbi:MAG: cupredoxin domain-containing protein [Methanosarcinales archaeon Met12]|nr:MAG: cupredoxin domain-containing protein [Methanosarcinales archaeon Met12]
MNKKITIGFIILAIIIGGYLILQRETVVPTPPQEIQTAPVKEIEMASGNFFFNPNSITVKKGESVRISFTNVGIHTFTIDELGVDVPLRGSSPVVEFVPTKTGTFQFYCAIP